MNKEPCSEKCFLKTIDKEVLSSLTFSAQKEQQKTNSSPTKQPPPLIYIDTPSEESSSEEVESSDEAITESSNSSGEDDNVLPVMEVAKKSGAKTLSDISKAHKSFLAQSLKGKRQNDMTGRSESLSNIEIETDTTLPDGWNGQEVTMFRMLHPLFGHNYCSIAEIICSKSCQEVL